MIVRSLELKNFRNFTGLKAEPAPGVNLIYGENAQGKTNILEAVYVSSIGRSHRGAKERDMITFGTDEGHIKCSISKKGVPHRIDVHLKKDRPKGVAVDGLPIRHTRQLLGTMHVVIFSPEDMRLIKEEPKRRRRFMDIELCQLDPVYAEALARYQKAVNQKNILLKDIAYRPQLKSTLPVWQEQQAHYGSVIIKSRRAFMERIDRSISRIHHDISGGREEVKVIYQANVPEDEILERIRADEEREIRFQRSLCGPQLDDLAFEVDGRDVRTFGSQGQQRTAALSLKMAEIELVRDTIHDEPVLLLDDVMSELDHERQEHLLTNIRGLQTLITCTGTEDIKKQKSDIEKIFHVRNGSIEEE
mgnify:CR=1 FL=1